MTAVQVTTAPTAAAAVTAITAPHTFLRRQDITEAARLARLAPINLQIHLILMTAAQATTAPTAATAVTAGTAVRMFLLRPEITETAKIALPARTDLQILITLPTAAQPTAAPTPATRAIATTVLHILQPQPDITETAKPARPAQINPITRFTQATAAQPTLALTARLTDIAITELPIYL